MVFQQVLILFIFVAIGYTLAKCRLVDRSHSKILSTLLVYVFSPCNVLSSFSRNFNRKYISENYVFILVGLAVVLLLAVGAFFASRLFSKDKYERKIYEYSLVIPNCGYMGCALAEAIFGAVGLINMIVFCIPATIYIYIYGFAMLTKRGVSLRKLINPMMITMILGIIIGLLEVPMPEIVTTVLSKSSGCMAPVSMLLAGIVISEFKFKEIFVNYKVYVLSAVTMIALPLGIGGLVSLMGNPALTAITVLFLALPCGLNTVVFPRLIGENCKIGASVALISTIIACFSIPAIFWIFGIA